MKSSSFLKFAILSVFSFIFFSCGKITFSLPNLLRGRWVVYGSTADYIVYELNLSEDGKYKILSQDSQTGVVTTETGDYKYSYADFNFSSPSGFLVFSSEGEENTKTYSFEESVNSTFGQVSLILRRQNTSSTEKLSLDYYGRENIDE